MNKILNTHRPLLRSFVTELTEKIFTQKQHDGNEGYLLNQLPELWDIDTSPQNILNQEQNLIEKNQPLTIKEYQSLVLNHIHEDKFKKQSTTLSFLYEDLKRINTILKKLDEIGIYYSWSIVGGAARDFILEKPIKDIDIMLSIPDVKQNWSILNNLTDISFLMKYFSKETVFKLIEDDFFNSLSVNIDLKDIDTGNEEEDEKTLMIAREKKQKLITLCFQEYISEQFSPSMNDLSQARNYSSWIKRKSLFGVIKLNQEKTVLNYPVDLLLTGATTLDFIKGFDFSLCKAAFTLKNHEYNVGFPSDPLELISRFSSMVSFWADVHNKKFTLEVGGMNEKMIEDAINIHYKRLILKYPDFKLNIMTVEDGPNALDETAKDNKIYADKLYLEESLERKEESKKMKL